MHYIKYKNIYLTSLGIFSLKISAFQLMALKLSGSSQVMREGEEV